MIGIVTYYHISNYGANLQAFALQHAIKKYHKKVTIIKYKSRKITNRALKKFFNKLKGEKNISSKVLVIYRTLITKGEFSRFRKKFLEFEKGESCFEKIIVGSDQVWNTSINQGDLYYYLNFYKGKKCAYAASFGYNNVPQRYIDILRPLLNDFYYIGIREIKGRDILMDQFDIKSEVVLDPTFLITQKEWVDILSLKCLYINKYLFIYIMGNVSDNLSKYICDKFEGFEYINYSNFFIKDKKIKNNCCKSPNEWLSYILHSEVVVTNSYHGVVFSIIFNRNFILYYSEKQHFLSRHWGLFSLLGIEGTIIDLNEDEKLFVPQLNYKIINSNIRELRIKSNYFLKKIISE